MVLEKHQAVDMYTPKLSCEYADFTTDDRIFNDASALTEIFIKMRSSGCTDIRSSVQSAVVEYIVELKLSVARKLASDKIKMDPRLSFEREFLQARRYVDGPMLKFFKKRQKILIKKALVELKYSPFKQFIIVSIIYDLIQLFKWPFVQVKRLNVNLFYRRVIFSYAVFSGLMFFLSFIDCIDAITAVKVIISAHIFLIAAVSAWKRWCL